MSDTDGTSSRPGSGSASSTQPLTTTGARAAETGSAAAAAGSGGAPGGASPGGGQGAPAGSTATAIPVAATSGKKPAAPQKAASQKPAPQPARQAPPSVGRRVRLTVSRVDPWSAMKMSFLLSVALGIAMVVMTFVLWSVLAGMGVFDKVNDIAANLFPVDSGEQAFDLMNYIGLPKVMSLAIVIGVIDVILITAIATLGAFLYNVSSALVGGLQLTLTDD